MPLALPSSLMGQEAPEPQAERSGCVCSIMIIDYNTVLIEGIDGLQFPLDIKALVAVARITPNGEPKRHEALRWGSCGSADSRLLTIPLPT